MGLSAVRSLRPCILFAGLLAAAPVAADEARPKGPGDFVAVGVGVAPEFLGSEDASAVPFFAGRYNAGLAVLELRGLGLAADFLGPRTGGAIAAGPLIRYRFGRDDVDNDAVDALEEVDGALELGGFVGYSLFGLAQPGDSLSFRVETAFDVSDGHGGVLMSPRVSYAFPVTRRLRTTLTASTEYGGGDFNDAFFSVDAAGSAASGLDTFEADGGFYRAGLSLGATYSFTETWGVTGLISYNRLIGDAADSPIVDDEGDADQLFGGVGVLYKF